MANYNLQLRSYRSRDDSTALDTSGGFVSTEQQTTRVTVDVTSGDVIRRVRWALEETASKTGTLTPTARYRIDGGSWVTITETSAAIQWATAATPTDGDTCDTRLLTGWGTPAESITGSGTFNKNNTWAGISIGKSDYIEIEAAFLFVRSVLNDAENIDIEIVGYNAADSNTQPLFTIAKTPATDSEVSETASVRIALPGEVSESASVNIEVITDGEVAETASVNIQTPYGIVVIDDGPAHYYRMNDVSGDAVDIVGGADITFDATPTYGVTGFLANDPDTAITAANGNFNSAGDVPHIGGGTALTVERWVDASLTSYQVDKYDGGANAREWRTYGATSIVFGVQPNPAAYDAAYEMTVSGLSADVHHVVCVFSGGSYMRIYVDGELAGEQTTSVAASFSDTTADLHIFGLSTYDEVAIYGSVLTPAQIRNHYLIGSGKSDGFATATASVNIDLRGEVSEAASVNIETPIKFDEKFEAAPGYDETWSEGETLTDGTLDEDYTRSSVTGAPTSWGDDCHQQIVVAAQDTIVETRALGDYPVTYSRVEVVVGANSLAATEYNHLIGVEASGGEGIWNLLLAKDGSGDLFLSAQIYHDATSNIYSYAISLDTVYCVEFYWDTTNDLWSWRVNESVQNSGSITSTATGWELDRIVLGSEGADTDAAHTAYTDNIQIRSDTWPGQTFSSATAGEVSETASVNVKVPSEVQETGSVRVSLLGEVSDLGSVRVALPGEVQDAASTNIALRGESSAVASGLFSRLTQLAKAASVAIALTGQVADTASANIALPSRAYEVASVAVALRGETFSTASVNISSTAEGEVSETASVNIKSRGQVAESASINIAGLARTTSGFLHSDDFDSDTRSDYTFSGSSTVTTSVTGGYLRLSPPDDNAIIAQVNGISVGKAFGQIVLRYPSGVTASYSALILRAAGWGSNPLTLFTDGYRLYDNTFDNIQRITNVVSSSNSMVDGAAESGHAANTWYTQQLFVDDDLQEGFCQPGDHAYDGTNADHNGEDARGVGFWGMRFAALEEHIDFDSVVFCKDKVFTCTGLPTGYQLKIYTSGDAEVFAATESSGTATIDVSKYTNTANALVPVDGWAYATVETAGDLEVARFDAEAVYPGDIFAFNVNDLPGEVAEAGSANIKVPGETQSAASINVTGTSFGEVSEPASVNLKAPSAYYDDASVRIALRGETAEVASTRIALRGESAETATVRIALPGETVADASVRIAFRVDSEVAEVASVNVALQGQTTELASANIAGRSEATAAASADVALQSESYSPASVNIGQRSEVYANASVNVVFVGESNEIASVRVKVPGETQSAASVNVTGTLIGEVSEPASVNLSAPSAYYDDASVRIALRGESADTASVAVALRAEVVGSASVNLELLSQVFTTASVNIASTLESEVASSASVDVALRGQSQAATSTDIALRSESSEAASADIALQSDVYEDASVAVALNGESSTDASANIGLRGESSASASANVGLRGESSSAASVNIRIQHIYESSLSNAFDPGVDTGHWLKYRVGKDSAGGEDVDITVGLYQGSTLIWSQNESLTTDATVHKIVELPSGNVANITNYLDLRVRATAIHGGGTARVARVYWWKLEIPPQQSTASEVSESASVNIALRGESTEAASVRIELLSESYSTASVHIGQRSEVYETASVRVALPGQSNEPASVRIKVPGETQSAASVNVTGTLVSEVSEPASVRLKAPSAYYDDASVAIALQGEQVAVSNVLVAQRGAQDADASVNISFVGQVAENASVNISLSTDSEVYSPASVYIGFSGEVSESASANVALRGQTQATTSTNIALSSHSAVAASVEVGLPSEVAYSGSVRVALPGQSSDVGSVSVSVPSEVAYAASVNVTGTAVSEVSEPASVAIKAPSAVVDNASVNIGFASQVSEPASVNIALQSRVYDDASVRIALSAQSYSTASVNIEFAAVDSEVANAASVNIALRGQYTETGSVLIELVGQVAETASVSIGLIGQYSADASVRYALRSESSAAASANIASHGTSQAVASISVSVGVPTVIDPTYAEVVPSETTANVADNSTSAELTDSTLMARLANMADTFIIKQGDRLPAIRATLTNADGTAIDLTNCTVRFHMRQSGTSNTKVDEVATIIDIPNGIVEYAWADGDTDTPSRRYEGEFEVTHTPTSKVFTVPNGTYISINILPEIT